MADFDFDDFEQPDNVAPDDVDKETSFIDDPAGTVDPTEETWEDSNQTPTWA